MTCHIFYHYPCPDGFVAACMVASKYVGTDVVFYPTTHHSVSQVDVADKDIVYVLDITLPETMMHEYADKAHKLVWIDHHIQDPELVAGLTTKPNVDRVWSDEESSASLAIRYVGHSMNWPWVEECLQAIVAADLGKATKDQYVLYEAFNISTQEVWGTPPDLDGLYELMSEAEQIYVTGDIEKSKQSRLQSCLSRIRFHREPDPVTGEQCEVATVSVDPMDLSYVAESVLDLHPYLDYCISQYSTPGGMYCSVRSRKHDCAALARRKGGGGHRFAAGFVIPYGDVL